VVDGNTHTNINQTTFIKHCIEIQLDKIPGVINESVHIIFRNIFLIKLWSTSPMPSHSNPELRWIALFWVGLVTLSTFMETHKSARSQT